MLSLNIEYGTQQNSEYVFDNYTIKTLGEVCEFIKGFKISSKDGANEKLDNLFLETFDDRIIINKINGSGKVMINYSSCECNDGMKALHFKSKSNELQTKYIYYYLLQNINLIKNCYKGSCVKTISNDDLFKIEIQFPTLDKQNEIVEYLDGHYLKINQFEKDIDDNKNQAELLEKAIDDNKKQAKLLEKAIDDNKKQATILSGLLHFQKIWI